jgi:methyl-accepting chemotaxis protein
MNGAPAAANRPRETGWLRSGMDDCSLDLRTLFVRLGEARATVSASGEQVSRNGAAARSSGGRMQRSRREIAKVAVNSGDVIAAIASIARQTNLLALYAALEAIAVRAIGAVEEQTVTTGKIDCGIAEAAKGVGDIAKNIAGLAADLQPVRPGLAGARGGE